MYSVEIAGRTKMKSLLKYERCRILQHTELKNVSAHSGCRCDVSKPMKCSLICCQISSSMFSASYSSSRRITHSSTRSSYEVMRSRASRCTACQSPASNSPFAPMAASRNTRLTVEAFEQRFRDIEADLRRQQLGKVIHIEYALRVVSFNA